MEEYRQITLDEWTQWKEDIRRKLGETAGNFVHIGYRLKQIRDSGMYDGAADIFAFAEKEYGLGKSTVSRFIAINEKYSEGGNSMELKEEFRGFSSSKLSEMLTLPDSEVELITGKTTIREIRELKAFNSQIPEKTGTTAGEEGKSAAAAGGEGNVRTALEKCLVDFFKDKKDMLNGVMRHLEEELPAYKEAAELMAPSQTSHKKGVVFLFLYDWNTGVKYKLMTEPEPVSISWAELLNTVYGIFERCEKDDVWGDFYKEPEEQKEDVGEDAEKTILSESDQGIAPVATSQQNAGKEQDNEQNGEQEKQKKTVEKAEDQNGQEAAGVENEEGRENTAQGEACAGSEPAGEPATGPGPADEAHGTAGGAGKDSAGGGADGEGSTGVAPVQQPESEQLKGQMNIQDFPEYMPDTETDGQEKGTEAAGVEGEPEKSEKTRMEVKSAAAAGVEDSGGKITNSDGMRRHIENQKQIISDAISLMSTYCDKEIWDGLIEEANAVITRAESIKNMVEVWNG